MQNPLAAGHPGGACGGRSPFQVNGGSEKKFRTWNRRRAAALRLVQACFSAGKNPPNTQEHKGLGMEPIGRKRWAIAEGYIPSQSSFFERDLISHETACILNVTDRQAHVSITIFFADREPVGPYQVTVEPRRTLHLRFNDLQDPAPIPRDTDYASVFESDVPIVLQHTRMDTRHAEVSLLSTIAYTEV
jgi:hypothetical protein